MKKSIFFTSVLCLMLTVAFAQSKFNIHLRAPLDANGTKVLFFIMDNNKRKVLKRDSAVIENHSLNFSGTILQPSTFINFYVRRDMGYSAITMVIDTGNNEFVLTALPIKGKPNSSITVLPLNSKSNQIKAGLDSIEMLHYDRNGITEPSGITTLSKEAMLVMNLERINYLKRYPSNYFSLIALYEISAYHRGSIYTNTVLDAMKTFDPILQTSTFGKEFYAEKMEYLRNLSSAKLGGPVPEFTVSDLSGKLFNNISLRGQNYIVIFSATWCVPCQKNLPEIKALYEKYKARGLKVVYFNQDNNVAAWRKHVERNKLAWINVSERVKPADSKISKMFNVYSVPSYFIVNKTSTIIHNSVESNSSVDALSKSLALLYEAKE